jgi:hypothetical protein
VKREGRFRIAHSEPGAWRLFAEPHFLDRLLMQRFSDPLILEALRTK